MIMNIFKPKRIGTGYLLRWHLIPRNRFFNIYLHKFIGDDDDRALHDHPWHSFSILLKGRLLEYHEATPMQRFINGSYRNFPELRRFVPRFCYRSAISTHRLELLDKTKPAWTLFITGPHVREWGFHCSKGWQHWSTMTTEKGETIGGCDN